MVEQCLQLGQLAQIRSLVLNSLITRPRNWFLTQYLRGYLIEQSPAVQSGLQMISTW